MGHFEHMFCLDIGSYKVMCKRTGSVLSCTTWHVDKQILQKVADRLGVTLYTEPSFEVKDSQHKRVYEMAAEVLEWSARANITMPISFSGPIGFGLAGRQCHHEWENVQLFTSSYSKCTKCGVEQ
jgi:hypothetical protein